MMLCKFPDQLRLAGSAMFALAVSLASAGSASSAQNFLVLVADDVGVDKIGAYRDGECVAGQCPVPPKTPVIDELAAQGVLFRNAWAAQNCSPGRATAFTGRHGFLSGVGGKLSDRHRELGVDPNAPNVASALKAMGYRTAAFGKWDMAGCLRQGRHCGSKHSKTHLHPVEAGMDYFAGSKGNIKNYCQWPKFVVRRAGPEGKEIKSEQLISTTYALVDTVDDAIAHLRALPEPWFVWFGLHSSHAPLHVPPELPQNCELDTSGDIVTRFNAVTEKMDAEIGRLLAALQEGSNPLARTTVVFYSDNGTGGNVTRPPFLAERAKGTFYEGGLGVPLIISGAGVAEKARGSESRALANSTDVFATAMDLAGSSPCPADSGCGEHSQSLVPYLRDPALPSLRKFNFADGFNPNAFEETRDATQAIRDERFKLIWRRKRTNASVEFFDLQEDPFEKRNLLDEELGSEARTALVGLSQRLREFAGTCIDPANQARGCAPLAATSSSVEPDEATGAASYQLE